MSLFDSVQTATSGISAHSTYLGIIGTNIANVSTTGYKASTAHFRTILGDEQISDYKGGGVQPSVRPGVTVQGNIEAATAATDLAINGNGFFVVQGPDGAQAMTRAGAFVPDANGNLINTAGYMLMGYGAQGGNALAPVIIPSGTSNITIARDGTLSGVNATGATTTLAKIPLASVTSPENLTALSGDVYQANGDPGTSNLGAGSNQALGSGDMVVGAANTGALGAISSGALESSTVDLASELTNMIKAQQGYEENAKVLTTSNDMLSQLFSAASG